MIKNIIKFSDRFVKKNPQIYEFVNNNYLDSFIQYIINSKYRKIVGLESWISSQVSNKSEILDNVLKKIKNYQDCDVQMIAILRYVVKNVKYKRDSVVWDMMEYWQTAEETINKRSGDCEDMSILMYVLARLKGVPSSRLFLFCGDVKNHNTKSTSGHCWLGYKANNYPLNFVFLDGCYYYNDKQCNVRNKFNIDGKKIFEFKFDKFKHNLLNESNYSRLWFAFNEDKSITKFDRIDTNRK